MFDHNSLKYRAGPPGWFAKGRDYGTENIVVKGGVLDMVTQILGDTLIKRKQIGLIAITGHGNVNLQMVGFDAVSDKTISKHQHYIRLLRPFMKNNAVLILEGCYAGKGDHLLMAFSQLLGDIAVMAGTALQIHGPPLEGKVRTCKKRTCTWQKNYLSSYSPAGSKY